LYGENAVPELPEVEITRRGLAAHLTGLTITGVVDQNEAFWWFNVRPSNTEPLLRLNVEAATQAQMEKIRDHVLGLIRA
jgi:phosphomannomutase